LHCFRFPRKRNACRNTGIARWLRTRNAEAAENCFLMSPSFSIYPRSRYGRKKYFRYVAFQRHRDATQRCIFAIVLLSCPSLIFSNIAYFHSPSLASKQSLKKSTRCKCLFISLFIVYARQTQIAFVKAPSVLFLCLEVYVDMTLRAILFFCGLNKFWALCNYEIFERTFYTSLLTRLVIVIDFARCSQLFWHSKV